MEWWQELPNYPRIRSESEYLSYCRNIEQAIRKRRDNGSEETSTTKRQEGRESFLQPEQEGKEEEGTEAGREEGLLDGKETRGQS